MSNERPSLPFEEPDEWPANEWPRFLEILRAFCLSDAEQNEYFLDLQEPHYHSAMGGDSYTLSSYYPPLADACDLCGHLWEHFNTPEQEMFSRLSKLFHESIERILERASHSVFPYASHTNLEELQIIRPELRALCNEALDFFGAEKRAPAMTWDEIAPQ